jgi:anthranilate/para-aminobenzoate synthase component II
MLKSGALCSKYTPNTSILVMSSYSNCKIIASDMKPQQIPITGIVLGYQGYFRLRGKNVNCQNREQECRIYTCIQCCPGCELPESFLRVKIYQTLPVSRGVPPSELKVLWRWEDTEHVPGSALNNYLHFLGVHSSFFTIRIYITFYYPR